MFTRIVKFILNLCGALFVVLVFLYSLGEVSETTPETTQEERTP